MASSQVFCFGHAFIILHFYVLLSIGLREFVVSAIPPVGNKNNSKTYAQIDEIKGRPPGNIANELADHVQMMPIGLSSSERSNKAENGMSAKEGQNESKNYQHRPKAVHQRLRVKNGGQRRLSGGDDDDDDWAARKINYALRRKARTFGQSGDEHKKVHEILKSLDIFVSEKHRSDTINGAGASDEEIAIEIGHDSNKTDASLVDNVAPPFNDTRQGDSTNIRFRDFAKRLPSKDYYKSKLKGNLRPGRFGDGDTDAATHGAEEKGRHFEGDIVLTLDQAEELLNRVVHDADKRKKRKFIATETRRWDPDRPIEYSFDGSHTIRERNLIELSLEHWQNVTCLNFQRRDDPPRGNRIVFTDVDGCASNVGRNPIQDLQFVSLASECIRLGVIAHEVAHALGFWHEQSRPDRDVFVNVKWNNIEPGSSGQFLKEKADDVDDEGIPYDYGSIMHYRSKAFSKSDLLYTITTNVQDYQRTIGQRDQLSFNDIRLMNKVYCSHKCPQKLNCLRGGYTDPRRCDRCRCPDGFTGKLCEKVMTGYGATCGGEVSMNSVFYYFNSPNYPQPFEEGQECSWLLRAPPGQIVELEFVGQFDLYCKIEHSLCMDYVEIRNASDFANTGMRFCCYSAPRSRILSETADLLVLFRSFYRSGVGFKIRARAIDS